MSDSMLHSYLNRPRTKVQKRQSVLKIRYKMWNILTRQLTSVRIRQALKNRQSSHISKMIETKWITCCLYLIIYNLQLIQLIWFVRNVNISIDNKSEIKCCCVGGENGNFDPENDIMKLIKIIGSYCIYIFPIGVIFQTNDRIL